MQELLLLLCSFLLYITERYEASQREIEHANGVAPASEMAIGNAKQREFLFHLFVVV